MSKNIVKYLKNDKVINNIYFQIYSWNELSMNSWVCSIYLTNT